MTNGRVALVGWADHVAQLDFFVKSPVLLGRVVLPGMQARAYCPDLLNGRHFTLEGDVAADVTEAETAITRLNSEALALADTEALARLLLRAESVASSRIEGLEIGARRLLRAEAARDLGERTGDAMAVEVLSNIDAMSAAISEVGPGDPISVATLLIFHQRLLGNTRQAQLAGRLREKQNWIGGSEYNPCSAAFIPPPAELVPDLMEDLCAFCTSETLPGVAQAAIAHAQFETIHPFADGNGRTGRALIQLVLRRRGLATRVLPPVSLVLATWASDYVDGLTATRYHGPWAEPLRSSAAAIRRPTWLSSASYPPGSCPRSLWAGGIAPSKPRPLSTPSPTWSASSQVQTEKPGRLSLRDPYHPGGQRHIKVCTTSLNKNQPC